MADYILKHTGEQIDIGIEKALSLSDNLQSEIDKAVAAAMKNTEWKQSVETFEDIVLAYPEPQDGWVVNVKDDNTTYRYDGSKWIAISANAIPLATEEVNGLMSKEDKIELSSVINRLNNLSSSLDGIELDDSRLGNNILWSSQKTNKEVDQVKPLVSKVNTSQDYDAGHLWIELL